MSEILFRTIRSCCGVGVYLILSMCWKMAEVKMYGFSQESIIDSFAAVGLAIGATEWMFSFVVKVDKKE